MFFKFSKKCYTTGSLAMTTVIAACFLLPSTHICLYFLNWQIFIHCVSQMVVIGAKMWPNSSFHCSLCEERPPEAVEYWYRTASSRSKLLADTKRCNKNNETADTIKHVITEWWESDLVGTLKENSIIRFLLARRLVAANKLKPNPHADCFYLLNCNLEMSLLWFKIVSVMWVCLTSVS